MQLLVKIDTYFSAALRAAHRTILRSIDCSHTITCIKACGILSVTGNYFSIRHLRPGTTTLWVAAFLLSPLGVITSFCRYFAQGAILGVKRFFSWIR